MQNKSRFERGSLAAKIEKIRDIDMPEEYKKEAVAAERGRYLALVIPSTIDKKPKYGVRRI